MSADELQTRDREKLRIILTENRTRIDGLKVENKSQAGMIEIVETNEEIIRGLMDDNDRLNRRIKELEIKLSAREAIEKLHECDAFANRNFQQEYRDEFKLDDYDKNIPTIGDFIRNPPSKNKHLDRYNFWVKFNERYPGSNNPEFNLIYRRINKSRTVYAHPDVSDITMSEVMDAVRIVFPEEYKTDGKKYDEYVKWLFSFPQ